jgi:hypothetical protein
MSVVDSANRYQRGENASELSPLIYNQKKAVSQWWILPVFSAAVQCSCAARSLEPSSHYIKLPVWTVVDAAFFNRQFSFCRHNFLHC